MNVPGVPKGIQKPLIILYAIGAEMSRKTGKIRPVYNSIRILKLGPKDMAYRKKIQKFRNATEIAEYHTGRYGAPGQKRQPKKKATPEQIKKINRYNREKIARWKLREWFDVNDYFSCLSYRKEARPPDMKMAKKDFANAVKIIRREYRKRGYELRWMRNIEVGTKGAWHIHVVINRITDTDLILKKAWTHGRITNELLYEKGEFRELAEYITKTPDTDPRLKETSYSASKNLPVPEPEVKTYKRWKTWHEIKIPEGFYLDKESLREGTNPVTGYNYRVYTLLRIRREQNVRGTHLHSNG